MLNSLALSRILGVSGRIRPSRTCKSLVRNARRRSIATEHAEATLSLVDFGRKVARSVAWMVLLRLALRALSVVSQLVLVRLLTPADFGLVAISGAALSVLENLTETSLAYALIRMTAPARHHYDTCWTLMVSRGLVIGCALWTVAPIIAAYMRDDRIAGIIHVLAIVPVLQGFESMGMIQLQRELSFGRIVAYQFMNKAVGFIVALPFVFIYRNYWALVLGGVAAKLIAVPLSYMLAPHRPAVSMRGFGELFHFSKWLLLTNALTMVDSFLMPLTLGRVVTMREVGLYQVANDFASLPASEIAAPVRRPIYAGYAQVAHDPVALRQQVLAGLGLLVMIIVPMSVGIAVTSPYVVNVVLGAQWADASSVLALAAVCALFDAIGHFSGNVYLVQNAQRPYVLIMAFCVLLRVCLVIPAAVFGGLTAAVAMMAFTAFVNAWFWFSRMRPLLALSWRDLVRPTGRSFVAAAAMAVIVIGVQTIWFSPATQLTMVAQWTILCGLGATVHVGAQLLLWWCQGQIDGPKSLLLEKLSAVSARLVRSQA